LPGDCARSQAAAPALSAACSAPEKYFPQERIKRPRAVPDDSRDPDVNCSREELEYRISLEDLHGEISEVINQEKLIPAFYMDDQTWARFKPPVESEDEE
jgi:hypothetical protein